MNGASHFAKFKPAYRHRMSVAHIGTPSLTHAHGNGSNGKMQHSVHLPDKLPVRMRVRERIKKVVGSVVTKNDQGRYSVSQPLALSVLGFMLIFGATWYWRSSDTISQQHDEIIRLQTMYEMEKQKNIDQDSKIDQARATAQIADKNSARLEGKFDQFALQYTTANPKKPVGPAPE